jgi:hypothetical protein
MDIFYTPSNEFQYALNNPFGAVDLSGLFRSYEFLRQWVPGQIAWDNFLTQIEGGNYLASVPYGSEFALEVLTAGLFGGIGAGAPEVVTTNGAAGGACQSVDELLANSTLTDETSRVLNYLRNGGGGFSKANAEFDSIFGDSPIKSYPGDVRSVPYGPGSASVRPSSSPSSGGARTIEINQPGQPKIKVRY